MPDDQRIHRPYWDWEDHAAGLYNAPRDLASETLAARKLLASPQRLLNAMRAVVHAWPLAAEHQLSNTSQNRRAWLGWSACRLVAGATATATKAAWPQLTDSEREAANACATSVIRQWEEDHADSTHQPTLPLDMTNGGSGDA